MMARLARSPRWYRSEPGTVLGDQLLKVRDGRCRKSPSSVRSVGGWTRRERQIFSLALLR